MRYEIATLTIRLGGANAVIAGVEAWTASPDAKGRLLGCWLSEIASGGGSGALVR